METPQHIAASLQKTAPATTSSEMPVQEQLQNELDILSLKKTSIQFKLSIGSSDDPLEHEADAVADTIMRMPEQNFIQHKCSHCEEEEKLQRKPLAFFIQRKESTAATVSSDVVSNKINASKGGGSCMDNSTQTFMQNRFAVDFSDVKIHTVGEAVQMNRELNARAFTVGNDIYFNEGQYNPNSNEGKHLLAHELTHTIQQKCADTNVIRRRNITGGEFGMELHHYSTLFSIPSQVFTLLARSATFMRMARTLDRHYIALDGSIINWDWVSTWAPDRDGVLTLGRFAGRRVIAVWYGSNGSEYLPAGSLDNDFGYDIILLKPPASSGNQEIGDWIEIIAHETTHAFTRNTSGARAGATALARITASITDEVNTRITEATVVGEATRGRPLTGYSPGTGSTNPAQVQRDMFPSSLKRTYLEQFVFNEMLRDAISTEGLSDTDIENHNRRVDGLSIEGLVDSTVEHPGLVLYFNSSSGIYELVGSRYDELRFIQRVINARWTRYELSSSGDPDIKERLLQEHATAFFNGIASYSPRP